MPVKSKRSPAKKKVQTKPKKSASVVFREILEERKRKKENFPQQFHHSNHYGGQYSNSGKHEQFAKFAGPRRRAA